jgi:DNA-directed RNA polymerase subunit RPC12/RpoP
MIKFLCIKCSQELKIEDKHSGKRVKCPKCGNIDVVPDISDKIKFNCENCGHKISAPKIYTGKKGKCPKCKTVIVIPGAESLNAVDSQTGAVRQEPSKSTGIVRFQCPMCDEDMQAPESSRGKILECPNCGSYAKVPGEENHSKDYIEQPQEQEPAPEPTEQSPAQMSQLSQPGSFAEPSAGESLFKNRLLIILIGAACIVGLLVVSIAAKFSQGIFLVVLVLGLVQIVSLWIVFEKAGQHGWAILIPFYSAWVWAEVGDKPGWWGLLVVFSGSIPGVIPLIGPYLGLLIGFALSLVISIGIAKTFERGVAFGIGLCFMPFVFYPILAFASD